MPSGPSSGSNSRDGSAVEVFDIAVPTEAAEGFEAISQEVVHLDSGSFRARRVVIRLASCQVVFLWARARLRSRGSIHEDLLSFTALAPSAEALLDGVALSPDALVVAAPGAVGQRAVPAR